MKSCVFLAISMLVSPIIFGQSNDEYLRSVGGRNLFTVGFMLPVGNTSKALTPPANYDETIRFFDGQYTGGLGAKYGLNASVGDVQINLYVGPQYKVSIDWNLIDAEYIVFDWSSNTFVKENDGLGSPLTELRSVKGGTRIGPAFTYLLSRTVAVTGYYSARPGVQFLLSDVRFNPNPSTSYTMEREYNNFNFSNEIGVKFHFSNKLTVNPFVHFGKLNWSNTIENATTGGSSQPVKANYSFGMAGLRLGIL